MPIQFFKKHSLMSLLNGSLHMGVFYLVKHQSITFFLDSVR